uniref:Uncharacterized protein n=1 Tax=Oryza brachyantha TaxID=4533 RepID=J3LM43_ORYBR
TTTTASADPRERNRARKRASSLLCLPFISRLAPLQPATHLPFFLSSFLSLFSFCLFLRRFFYRATPASVSSSSAAPVPVVIS